MVLPIQQVVTVITYLQNIFRLKNNLIKQLALIINQIFNTGIFSAELKIAKIIPIFKKGDKSDINNYRSISVLPVISKIIERVLHSQLHVYLNQHNLLYNHQYGFRKQHSAELAAQN